MMYKFSGQRDLDALASFARNGYSNAEGKAVPKALGFAGKLKKSINKMVGDIVHIWDLRRLAGFALFLSGAMFGLAFGMTIGAVITERSYRKMAAKNKSKKSE
eukprot:Protomagalhaensia_sp_Gyna_25__2976@NODE_2752_length_908_cov_3343_853855_g2296_i0_p2_GENE_NODE_2752_length_908_cov_3343_853855_g2296_i0NODE_2752_length_908_cov_3343_853855_g2296_i0_p2_ORF_typecomplete_len103_score13_41_NODE_2752_length_908_cov_3343_853855_g2296_i0491799